MTTFSQLVDKMVAETKRVDLKTEIGSYLNQTIRELHFEPGRGNSVDLKSNLKEATITATGDNLTWTMPDSAVFGRLAAVRYDSVRHNDSVVWPVELVPGRAMGFRDYYYYQAGDGFAFYGFGGNGASVSLAWYEYPRGLKYYATADRPATYDLENGWTYLPSYDVNDSTRQTAREKTSNWILLRWDTFIEEGLRAKIYKRLSDDARARTAYSMYMMQRQGFYTAEGWHNPGVT